MSKVSQMEVRSGLGPADVEIVLVFQTSGKKKAAKPALKCAVARYQALLQKSVAQGVFVGAPKSWESHRFAGEKGVSHLLFVGCGPKDKFDDEGARIAAATAYSVCKNEKFRSACVRQDSLGSHADSFCEGWALTNYRFEGHHTAEGSGVARTRPIDPQKFIVNATNASAKKAASLAVAYGQHVAEAVFLTRDWSNEAPNIANPDYFAAEIRKLGKKHGLRVRILNEAQARKENLYRQKYCGCVFSELERVKL